MKLTSWSMAKMAFEVIYDEADKAVEYINI